MSLAGSPTVVLGEMHVIDLREVRRDHPDGILFLDVGVERVIEQAVVGRVDLANDVGGVGDRIEHITFEARASGRVVAEIDGRRAFDVFAERARPLLDDLGRAAQSVLLAVPDDPEDGDVEDGYVVRGILRFDPDRGLLALSSPLVEGMRIRFAVRDAYAAREDLRRVVGDIERRLEGRRPRYGFYFTGAGRGRALYGVEDHDVAYLRSTLGEFPLLGAFTGGEIGPAALRPRLHLFAGVLAVVP